MSLQLHPEVALVGERCPFVAFPFPLAITGSSFMVSGFVVANGLAELRPESLRFLIGLLLFDLALLRSIESSSSSRSSFIGVSAAAFFFFADLVTGPKYPSCDDSRASEGVGEGEITLGVAGIGFEDDLDIVKGSKGGVRRAPENIRPISATLRSQLVEWRCLSFREARMVVTEDGKDELWVIGSSGRGRAEQNRAASLEKVMMTLFAPLKWHTKLYVVCE